MPNIYVLSADEKPLMPMHSYKRVRTFLRTGKARIASYKPFTIQLTYQTATKVTDECFLGIDPGRTNIGLCVIDNKGNVLFASDVETRNKTIAKLMLERKAHRQASRRGKRKRRQRRAVAAGLSSHTEYYRMLPGYENPVCCKVIRNTESRFNNRKRPSKWLTPTARQLLETYIHLIQKVQKILPITSIVLEINVFDFQKMENPKIRNWQYQKGRLYGFKDVYEAVDYRQKNTCLLCKKRDIEHYHHVIQKSKGGSDTLDNLAGLCIPCHCKIHTDSKIMDKMLSKHKGLLKKYHALSAINQIIPFLLKELPEILPTYVTTGHETKAMREAYNLPKDHYVDAYCIAMSVLELSDAEPVFEDNIHNIKQYRRHDRSNIKAQYERTYYLDGQKVAKNRKPRIEQVGPSLSDLHLTKGQLARLTVKKSCRSYNDKTRLMPGTVFLYNGKRHVMSGQLTNGQYLRAIEDNKTNYPTKRCKIIQRNAGLVYL